MPAAVCHLAQLMVEARAQLAQLHPEHAPDLHERFLSWARARGDAGPGPDGDPAR
ncbi:MULTISPECIES: hypothetical protein [unclassified Micromonospora]|uniref:hypothetical protein n=1 Tax=unclassified Micromonospora TaxID=2617518 RepID=UPI0013041B6E|nr:MULTISPECIES: hypothetical protein [unclassified Micromonospora]MDI5940701.1 hypothetical protein [Micromonospora sp. DH15]